MGTARYSAPEILRKEKSFSEKADVYSFALLLYEMLTFETPFDDVQFCYEVEERVIAGLELFLNFVFILNTFLRFEYLFMFLSRCATSSPSSP